MIGRLWPKRAMFLRFHCGEAKNGRQTYELSTSVSHGIPIIRNTKTGRQWTINWSELLTFAKAAGIDRPFEKEEP